MKKIKIVGAGLAGSEAAWQAAQRGIEVELYEMRPEKSTPAHKTAGFAELVMRALVAILGAHFFGYSGVAAANPAAWIGAVAILIPSLLLLIRSIRKENEAVMDKGARGTS